MRSVGPVTNFSSVSKHKIVAVTNAGQDHAKGAKMRRRIVVPFFLAIGLLYAAFPNARPDLRWNWYDPAQYVALSYNLTHYGAFTLELEPPFRSSVTFQTPGFPLLLAPATALFGRDLLALKLLMVAYSIATLFAVYALFARQYTWRTGVFITASTAFNLHWFIASHQTMAVIPAIGSIVVALLAIDVWVAGGGRSRWQFSLALVTGAIACYMKGYGLCLIPAACFCILRAPRISWKSRAVAASSYAIACAVIGLSWPAIGLLHPQEGYGGRGILELITRAERHYGEGEDAPRAGYEEVCSRMWGNAKWGAVRWSAQAVLPATEVADSVNASRSGTVVRVLCCIPVVLGWIFCIRRRNSAIDPFVGFYILLILYIVGGTMVQYWIQLIPFSIAYAVEFVQVIFSQRLCRPLAAIAMTLYSVVFAFGLFGFEHDPYDDPLADDYVAILNHANGHLPADAVLVTHHSHCAWLLTGWVCHGLPASEPKQRWDDVVRDAGKRPVFLLVRNTERQTEVGDRERLVAGDPAVALSLLYEQGAYSLLKLEKNEVATAQVGRRQL